jgi:hypothetical protein
MDDVHLADLLRAIDAYDSPAVAYDFVRDHFVRDHKVEFPSMADLDAQLYRSFFLERERTGTPLNAGTGSCLSLNDYRLKAGRIGDD